MPVNAIPDNIRLPLFYAEVNAVPLPTADEPNAALIVGPTYVPLTDDDGAEIEDPIRVTSVTRFMREHSDEATGTPLEYMLRTYRDNDTSGPLYVLPTSSGDLPTAASPTPPAAGTGLDALARTTINIGSSCPTNVAANFDVYQGNSAPIRFSVTLTGGDQRTQASTLRHAFNTNDDIVGIFADGRNGAAAENAAATNGAVTFFAGNLTWNGADSANNNSITYGTGTGQATINGIGTIGNQFKIVFVGFADGRANENGIMDNASTPDHLDIGAELHLTGATATHSHVQGLLASSSSGRSIFEDGNYDFFAMPTSDTGDLTVVSTVMTERWNYQSQKYGHAFCGAVDTVSNLQTTYGSLDYSTISVVGINGVNAPDCLIGAAITGAVTGSLRADPGQPLHTLPVKGLGSVPTLRNRFTFTERNNLLNDGVSLIGTTPTGTLQILRIVTMDTDTWRNVEQRYLAMHVIRTLRDALFISAGRAKIVADGSVAAGASNVVTPSSIRTALISAYRQLAVAGHVQDSAAFEGSLLVSQNPTDPNRVDIAIDANNADQLQVLATVFNFT